MDYAHYSALSEADWLAVKQERLMLDMPLTINWDHMDARLLERFFSRRPQRSHNLYRYVPVPCEALLQLPFLQARCSFSWTRMSPWICQHGYSRGTAQSRHPKRVPLQPLWPG